MRRGFLLALLVIAASQAYGQKVSWSSVNGVNFFASEVRFMDIYPAAKCRSNSLLAAFGDRICDASGGRYAGQAVTSVTAYFFDDRLHTFEVRVEGDGAARLSKAMRDDLGKPHGVREGGGAVGWTIKGGTEIVLSGPYGPKREASVHIESAWASEERGRREMESTRRQAEEIRKRMEELGQKKK